MRFSTGNDQGNGVKIAPDEPLKARTETTDYEHENSWPNEGDSRSATPDYLEFAARATNDAIRDWNVKSGRLDWPQGLHSLLGYPLSTARKDIGFWQQQLHPDDRARTAAAIRAALNSGDEHWAGEYRFRRADGTYIHLLERALIVRDHADTAIRFVGTLMDVTARKQLQDQVSRSQKMEAFGQLAGGVAHDFNNFLTAILGYSDLVLAEMPSKGAAPKYVEEIRCAAGRASALTRQLLAFSRRHPLEPRVLEVNTSIANLERSVLRLLGENIDVTCELHASDPVAHIKFDPGQLTQIIINLAVNARDAMPRGGRLVLETATLDVTDDFQGATPPEMPPGHYAIISVSDTGVGMNDEVKSHLFEPFFTTKEDNANTGLGLATCYGLIRQSGGYIMIDSEPNRGTTVRIFLPIVPAPPAPSYKKPRNGRLQSGTEKIVVLEDDASVRHVSVRILRSLGYKVIEAATGEDAQRLIREAGGKIDLVVTDMVMPQMSGREFAHWVSKETPSTRIVFVSGYLPESLQADHGADTEMFFLAKPFDPEELATKVREALDSAPAR